MTLHYQLASVTPTEDTLLTIGMFDGVHIGHQHLLKRLGQLALDKGLLPGVVTFKNHPSQVLRPESRVQLIAPLEMRKSLIRNMGIGFIVDLEFTREFSLLLATEFVSLLVKDLRMKGLVVGPDFAMGHNRKGNIPTLQTLAKKMDFHLEVVEPRLLCGQVVKSSDIRTLVATDEVDQASQMLGRPFALTGSVSHGKSRGRILGFPTANLKVDSGILMPSNGIYASWATIDGRRFQAATSVGVNPTFGSGKKQVEAFLIDFQGDLYNRTVQLEFISYLRSEYAFTTVEDLVRQMQKDVNQIKSILSHRERQDVA